MMGKSSNDATAGGEGGLRRCSLFRECGLKECIFFEGWDHCWTLVSPFKLRRCPSRLLDETAERCGCLSIPCPDCENYRG